jgi:hypothetical protein
MIRGRDRLCGIFRSVLTFLLLCGLDCRLGLSCVTVVTLACVEEALPVSDQRPQTFLGRRSLRITSLLEVEIELWVFKLVLQYIWLAASWHNGKWPMSRAGLQTPVKPLGSDLAWTAKH